MSSLTRSSSPTARAPPWRSSPTTTAAWLIKQRGLLQVALTRAPSGSGGVGVSSTKAAAARSDDKGLGFGPDGPRFGLVSFLFLKINF
jgi:hypothetical protein